MSTVEHVERYLAKRDLNDRDMNGEDMEMIPDFMRGHPSIPDFMFDHETTAEYDSDQAQRELTTAYTYGTAVARGMPGQLEAAIRWVSQFEDGSTWKSTLIGKIEVAIRWEVG